MNGGGILVDLVWVVMVVWVGLVLGAVDGADLGGGEVVPVAVHLLAGEGGFGDALGG